MNNYKKDKSYIKQRLEYVSPVDYISELEEQIEYLEYLKNENERLNNIIDELEKYCKSEINSTPTFSFDRYYTPGFNDGVEDVLDKLKELKGETNE